MSTQKKGVNMIKRIIHDSYLGISISIDERKKGQRIVTPATSYFVREKTANQRCKGFPIRGPRKRQLIINIDF